MTIDNVIQNEANKYSNRILIEVRELIEKSGFDIEKTRQLPEGWNRQSTNTSPDIPLWISPEGDVFEWYLPEGSAIVAFRVFSDGEVFISSYLACTCHEKPLKSRQLSTKLSLGYISEPIVNTIEFISPFLWMPLEAEEYDDYEVVDRYFLLSEAKELLLNSLAKLEEITTLRTQYRESVLQARQNYFQNHE